MSSSQPYYGRGRSGADGNQPGPRGQGYESRQSGGGGNGPRTNYQQRRNGNGRPGGSAGRRDNNGGGGYQSSRGGGHGPQSHQPNSNGKRYNGGGQYNSGPVRGFGGGSSRHPSHAASSSQARTQAAATKDHPNGASNAPATQATGQNSGSETNLFNSAATGSSAAPMTTNGAPAAPAAPAEPALTGEKNRQRADGNCSLEEGTSAATTNTSASGTTSAASSVDHSTTSGASADAVSVNTQSIGTSNVVHTDTDGSKPRIPTSLDITGMPPPSNPLLPTPNLKADLPYAIAPVEPQRPPTFEQSHVMTGAQRLHDSGAVVGAMPATDVNMQQLMQPFPADALQMPDAAVPGLPDYSAIPPPLEMQPHQQIFYNPAMAHQFQQQQQNQQPQPQELPPPPLPQPTQQPPLPPAQAHQQQQRPHSGALVPEQFQDGAQGMPLLHGTQPVMMPNTTVLRPAPSQQMAQISYQPMNEQLPAAGGISVYGQPPAASSSLGYIHAINSQSGPSQPPLNMTSVTAQPQPQAPPAVPAPIAVATQPLQTQQTLFPAPTAQPSLTEGYFITNEDPNKHYFGNNIVVDKMLLQNLHHDCVTFGAQGIQQPQQMVVSDVTGYMAPVVSGAPLFPTHVVPSQVNSQPTTNTHPHAQTHRPGPPQGQVLRTQRPRRSQRCPSRNSQQQQQQPNHQANHQSGPAQMSSSRRPRSRPTSQGSGRGTASASTASNTSGSGGSDLRQSRHIGPSLSRHVPESMGRRTAEETRQPRFRRPPTALQPPGSSQDSRHSSDEAEPEEDKEEFKLELKRYNLDKIRKGTVLRFEYLCLVRGLPKLVDYFGVYVGNCLVVHCSSLDDPALEHVKSLRDSLLAQLAQLQQLPHSEDEQDGETKYLRPRCHIALTRLTQLEEHCYRVVPYTVNQVMNVCGNAKPFSSQKSSRRATQMINYAGYGDVRSLFTGYEEDFDDFSDVTRNLVMTVKTIHLKFTRNSLAFAMWCCYGSKFVFPYEVLLGDSDEDDLTPALEGEDNSRLLDLQRHYRAAMALNSSGEPLCYYGGCLYSTSPETLTQRCFRLKGEQRGPQNSSRQLQGREALPKSIPSLNFDAPTFVPRVTPARSSAANATSALDSHCMNDDKEKSEAGNTEPPSIVGAASSHDASRDHPSVRVYLPTDSSSDSSGGDWTLPDGAARLRDLRPDTSRGLTPEKQGQNPDCADGSSSNVGLEQRQRFRASTNPTNSGSDVKTDSPQPEDVPLPNSPSGSSQQGDAPQQGMFADAKQEQERQIAEIFSKFLSDRTLRSQADQDGDQGESQSDSSLSPDSGYTTERRGTEARQAVDVCPSDNSQPASPVENGFNTKEECNITTNQDSDNSSGSGRVQSSIEELEDHLPTDQV